ncbi:predicted protein [Nematostella vectensis]|uniref:HECT domain-containing protein n=1 Tax=Nematostella vectensis TaxID=45351 RepID=A7SQH6_NEMVE|nr:predicted protein [Nematostella vectensis]|eukprot:XP_001626137.1 predicted protein [Nematostella vectensis]
MKHKQRLAENVIYHYRDSPTWLVSNIVDDFPRGYIIKHVGRAYLEYNFRVLQEASGMVKIHTTCYVRIKLSCEGDRMSRFSNFISFALLNAHDDLLSSKDDPPEEIELQVLSSTSAATCKAPSQGTTLEFDDHVILQIFDVTFCIADEAPTIPLEEGRGLVESLFDTKNKHVHRYYTCRFDNCSSISHTESQRVKHLTYKFKHDWLFEKVSFDLNVGVWWLVYVEGEGMYCLLCRKHKQITEVNQYMEGLKTCCMLGLVQAYPEKFRTVFEVPKKLTAEMLDDFFDVKYSPRDSNKFHAETEVIFNLTQYLEDIKKGQISSILEGKEVVVTLNHVIRFLTGSHGIPAIGFTPRPSIHFNQDNPNRKLTANTCANQLTLTVDGRIRKYEHFSQDFTFCMFNSPGFGLL